MNVVVVYNPKSGSSLSEPALRQKFKRHAIKIDALIGISNALAQDLASHIQKKATICAIGGDGTLSAVASVLAGTGATFVPLPGGTLNHFTKDLGIPQNIDQALGALHRSKVHAIDMASVNGSMFINNSSLGLYPSSLHTRERFEDYLGKWPAAVIASLRSLLRFRTYTVTVDGKTFRTPFIFVGNNIYEFDAAGGIKRTRITEGVLSVWIARTASRWVLTKIVLWALIGKASLLNEFDQRTAKTLTIKTNKRRLSVACDGEVGRIDSPVRYKTHPRALRIRY
jgi:diacylglycerol kinase family enzyme